jgi:hypothetical protein
MRSLLLLFIFLLPSAFLSPTASAQTSAAASAQQTAAELQQAIAGAWTGVLEYRDYSEPETSTRRVKLPTWLSVGSSGDKLTFHYIYDDGPNKVVDETLTMSFDVAGSTLQITNSKGHVETYKVDGYNGLRSGRGDITLLGPTIDNDRPAECRIVIGVRRNLLTWVEEVRPTSAVPFAFRHSYTFTRAQTPQVTSH